MTIPEFHGKALTPIEMSYLCYGELTVSGALSTVISLADRGVLSIGKVPEEGYDLVLHGEAETPEESILLQNLFKSSDSVNTRELSDSVPFQKHMRNYVKSAMEEHIETEFSYLEEATRKKKRNRYKLLILGLTAAGCLIAFLIGSSSRSVPAEVSACIFFGIMALIKFVFDYPRSSKFIPELDPLLEEIEAFRHYLLTESTEDEFNVLFPYAFALDEANSFCHRFWEKDIDPPKWFLKRYSKGQYCGDWNGDEAFGITACLKGLAAYQPSLCRS